MEHQIVIIYLIVVNVVAFLAFGVDKWKSKRDKWRIPEAQLLGLAVIGAA